jgi:hypothetical protein
LKIRTSIAAAGAAALVSTGAFVLPALASSHGSTHTLKFISVQKNSVNFTKVTVGQQDTDVNAKGKTIGFDELYIVFHPKTKTGTANATLDTNGGMLYAVLKVSISGKSHGTVTGGTGAFKGATGTISGKSISSTKTAVTVTYRT